MKILTDYQGEKVRLTDERLNHIIEHPEMVNMESAIEETLSKPELVIRSRTDEMTNLNYRYYYRTKVGDKWREDIFVLTAYLTDKPKKGVQLWPSK